MNTTDSKDSLTKLNTQINRSMVLMDHNINDDAEPSHRSPRAIKINTTIQPASRSSSTHNVLRKSILKKTSKDAKKEESNDSSNIENELERLNNETQQRLSMGVPNLSRPLNIQDLIEREGLVIESADSTFCLEDISQDEEVWIMDIPKTINPQDLNGQTLTFGKKSKLKVNEEKYDVVKHDIKSEVACVVKSGAGKQHYKTVKIKPVGGITFRKKLSTYHKMKPMDVEDTSVPFPKNLRTRHPLFGVSHDGKVKKSK